mmetsp:Transcript_18423/g.55551  ORF Transcript_18423/g.55551 Transcript_18423/m.55551 type:complete len:285 (+) Transcript_18423:2720-3574(+)
MLTALQRRGRRLDPWLPPTTRAAPPALPPLHPTRAAQARPVATPSRSPRLRPPPPSRPAWAAVTTLSPLPLLHLPLPSRLVCRAMLTASPLHCPPKPPLALPALLRALPLPSLWHLVQLLLAPLLQPWALRRLHRPGRPRRVTRGTIIRASLPLHLLLWSAPVARQARPSKQRHMRRHRQLSPPPLATEAPQRPSQRLYSRTRSRPGGTTCSPPSVAAPSTLRRRRAVHRQTTRRLPTTSPPAAPTPRHPRHPQAHPPLPPHPARVAPLHVPQPLVASWARLAK